MANLPETPQWEDGIYQIEVSDPVLGGPDGISNRQAKQLAKRTSYLKQQVESGDKDLADHIAAPNPHSQYAPKESPALTGTPTAPTAIKTDNSTKLATTGHVKNVVADYAPLASPGLTGKPTAPTAAQASNDTQLATTAFVKAALAALVASSPEALDTLNELAAALGNDPNFATTMTNALAGKQPLDTTLTNLSGKSISGLLEYLQLGEAAKRDVGSGAGQVPDMSHFQSGGGWFKLPSGYVIQAFEASFDSNGLYINFPIPFPSSVIAIVPGVLMSTTASPSLQFPSIQRDVNDLTRFFAKYNMGGMNSSYFIAIGK
ncbi:phage tail protein [Salmonella enterica]